MLWSLLKIVIFLCLAVLAAFGAGWLLDSPGGVTIAFSGREYTLSPIGFVVALLVLMAGMWILLRVIALLGAVVRFLLGDETAISRHFRRSRERKGFDALSDGIVALVEGDPRAAMKKVDRAQRLLQRPELTSPLGARAAEMAGDTARAKEHYKTMLAEPRTRFGGIMLAMQQKLDEGDADAALELARKAHELRPSNPLLLRTLFDLQTRKGDWAGARSTMNSMMHARMLPRDVGVRRDAVLSLADAKAAFALGDATRGQEAAVQANKLAPTLVPAAALAAEVQVEKAAFRKASKLLSTAWAANPHPDLAAAYAAIHPEESPEARRKRFAALIATAPDDSESRLLAAELALAAEDFPGARKGLGDLAEREPTARSLAIMAAIERGQGAPETVVRGWLAKAINAPRGPQWICERCNHVHSAWMPTCENCGAFDTLAWKSAPHAEDTRLARSAMLPIMMDEKAAPAPAADAAADLGAAAGRDGGFVPPRPDVEDAELAAGAEPPARGGAVH